MSRRRFLCCIAVTLAGWSFTLVAAAQETPKKYALLIGIDTYSSAPVTSLDYADDDAEALAAELKRQGYDPVIPLIGTNATRKSIMRWMYKLAKDVRPNDTFLLYFAGHGMRSAVGGKWTYWLTVDADASELDVEGIRLNHMREYVADIQAKRKIIILDHCFSADVLADAAAKTGTRDPGQPNVQPRPGIVMSDLASAAVAAGGSMVITAARGYAYELKELKHGVLTAALLEAFTTNVADTSPIDKTLSAAELEAFLRNRVTQLSKDGQTPDIQFDKAVNTTEWSLVDNLPLSTPADVSSAVARYRSLFASWRAKDWLTPDEFNDGRSMLDTWLSSATEAGRPLTPREAEVIKRLRQNMDDGQTPAQARAEVVKHIINEFVGKEE